jgi:hypothetical protein
VSNRTRHWYMAVVYIIGGTIRKYYYVGPTLCASVFLLLISEFLLVTAHFHVFLHYAKS